MISTTNHSSSQVLGLETLAVNENNVNLARIKVKVRHVILNTLPFGIINFLLGGARCGGLYNFFTPEEVGALL